MIYLQIQKYRIIPTSSSAWEVEQHKFCRYDLECFLAIDYHEYDSKLPEPRSVDGYLLTYLFILLGMVDNQYYIEEHSWENIINSLYYAIFNELLESLVSLNHF